MKKENILEQFPDEDFLFADGFDDAIIGIDSVSRRVIYSVFNCIEILMDEMSEEEAIDYFEFNTLGVYVGEKTPVWCFDNF